MNANENAKEMLTNDGLFICHCGKSYKHQSSLCRHTKTCNPNKILTNPNKILTNPTNKYSCACGKKYQHRSTLSHHKKTCSHAHAPQKKVEPTMTEEEFQTRMVNTLKELLPKMGNTTNNITNNNNKRISNNQINIFLNEKCANAMSIQDFAKQITFALEDLAMNKQDSLVKVIQTNLDPLGITERPVHCSNIAKRKWHVNDETDGWKKDDGKALIKIAEHEICKKWAPMFEAANPNWINNDHQQDEYLKIINTTMESMQPKAEARVLGIIGETTKIDNESIK